MVTSIQLTYPNSQESKVEPLWVTGWLAKLDRFDDHRCVAQIPQSLSTQVGGGSGFESPKYFFTQMKLFWQVLLCFDILWQHLQLANLHLNLNFNYNFDFINDNSREGQCLQQQSMPGSGKHNSVKYEHFGRALPRFLSVCMRWCKEVDENIGF